MQVNIIEEAGYNTALYGFSLSYKDRAIPREEWWCLEECDNDCDNCNLYARMKQTERTATANAGRGMGHDKWLRQVSLWLDVEAPRYWWSEMDTYKVGTVAQSESTMHTILKRDLVGNDFQNSVSQDYLDEINSVRLNKNIVEIKGDLKESYLQRRVVSLNYAVLRCIVDQRSNHKLPEWKQFIDSIYSQCSHPELLPKRVVERVAL